MRSVASRHQSVRVHLTNVFGAGASQLLLSLLPALESNRNTHVDTIYLPNMGALKNYTPASRHTKCIAYRRRLPNALSRILECTVLGRCFSGQVPLLVLGDLPIRCDAPQTVFVQTTHLVYTSKSNSLVSRIKFWIARQVFSMNQKYAAAFIVQTELMRNALLTAYPALQGRVYVVGQPVPAWLLSTTVRHQPRSVSRNTKLRLFYPAALYPHKNHQLLAQAFQVKDWPIESLLLTLEQSVNPSPGTAWLQCVGSLSPPQMIDAYTEADGLLFLSLTESYGFPLIEAMFFGLPIICPDLPYARSLCGCQAIYFDPNNIQSLYRACTELKTRLISGRQPDWQQQIAKLPKTWEEVARQMMDVVSKSYGQGAAKQLNN